MVATVLAVQALMPPAWTLAQRLSVEVISGAGIFAGSAFVIQRRRLGELAGFARSIRNA